MLEELDWVNFCREMLLLMRDRGVRRGERRWVGDDADTATYLIIQLPYEMTHPE